MLRSAKEIRGYALAAADGAVGRCKDLLFDDRDWTIRYVVASTRRWLPGPRVVVSPRVLGRPDSEERVVPVQLATEEVEGAPPLEDHLPVSQLQEQRYPVFWGHPNYWLASGPLGADGPDGRERADDESGPDRACVELEQSTSSEPATSLRSANEICGYRLRGTGGVVGTIADMIIDDEAWTIRQLVIATRPWRRGDKVLLATDEAGQISWREREVRVGLPVARVLDGPPFDPAKPVNQVLELRLYDYRGRPAGSSKVPELTL